MPASPHNTFRAAFARPGANLRAARVPTTRTRAAGQTWASTVSDRYIEDATVEWDLYGGLQRHAASYSVLAYYYKYPGVAHQPQASSTTMANCRWGLSYKMLYAKYNHTVTPDFFGITNGGTGYLDVGANDLGNAWTLNLHAGNGRVAGSGNAIWNWRDAKVGVTRAFDGGWSLEWRRDRAPGAPPMPTIITRWASRMRRPVRHLEPRRDDLRAGHQQDVLGATRDARDTDFLTKEQPHATLTEQQNLRRRHRARHPQPRRHGGGDRLQEQRHEAAALELARTSAREVSGALQARIASNLASVSSLAGAMRGTKSASLPLQREQINELTKATLNSSEDLLALP